ncbi:hypothetical protein lb338_phage_34 [Lactobacillus phage Lb338-1]|uniref:Uncharacterized protein n=1 Tax=Lactobacillus phage Lb338-1 TaxID=2892342 RepID=C1KFE4_9CAUD|nr:hypothetical protein lb338_phage_34 [Lactobacillus phage Lb338-1]ACO36955.1 hypothetical protein lb338_phage_34 [Lactobacillus phage Lb338-1]
MSDANFEALTNTINVSLSGVQEKAAKGDYEAAHADEDDLYDFVLQRIAKSDMTIEQAKCIASLALETNNIDFTRWYA